jgi:hypothetical protein
MRELPLSPSQTTVALILIEARRIENNNLLSCGFQSERYASTTLVDISFERFYCERRFNV